MVSSLIAVVLSAFLWAAYRRVERALVASAGERAQVAADQVAGLLDGQRATDQLRRLAVDPVLRRFLEQRTDAAREAAVARLNPLLASSSARVVEVWDAGGTRMLELKRSVRGGAAPESLPDAPAPTAAGIGKLQAAGQTVFFELVAEITGEAAPATRLGYVRVRSTFLENPPGIFSRLVGHGAAVAVGNQDGGVWTDFSRTVTAPPVEFASRGVRQYTTTDGERRLGAVAPIRATPWAAWVEFPYSPIVAPARAFLRGMLVVAAVFAALTALASTILAGRLTKPLSELSEATAAIAAGDYSRRVRVTRRDEIGRLARTFNQMAADIQQGSDALRASEESYRRLFASNPHPMWVYDAETLRFLDVNNMAVAHYGYSREEFLAMTITDIRPESDVPRLVDSVAHAAPTVEHSQLWKHRKKDGTLIDVEVSSHELLLDGRRARSVLAHDVTERLRAQQAVKESEALFRDLVETLPQIVWTTRPDGRAAYYNHRWNDYTGLDREATVRAGWHSVIHPDDRQQVQEGWTEALRTGHAYEMTYRIRRAQDGAYRWHLGRAAPLRNEGGEIVLWVGSSIDIDDAKRAEDRLAALNQELEQRVLARTAELEAANQELESFSYSVSHDLRAPLRHVQGYVEMLTAEARGQRSEKAQRYLKTITDATVDMGELIDDLLTFSRIARVQMSERPVALEAIVRSTIRGLELTTRNRNIVWTVGALPVAVGDPSMLKQVYANLLENAVKYTRRRDPAIIEIGCAGEEDGKWILFVRDNGAGFDMRYAHKLFGVFQRLHRPDEFEGTGIGLATVRRIVNRHGGRTWAEGKVDEGATIYFTLSTAAPRSARTVEQR